MDNEARLRMSLDYIENHLEEDLNLPDIAAQAWFSAYHFHRLFLLHTGYTVMDYVRQRRLIRSASHLKQNHLDLTEVAIRSGFNSRETYTRAYRKAFGMSPGKSRRRNRYPSDPGIRLEEGKTLFRSVDTMLYGLSPRMMEMPGRKLAGFELKTKPDRSMKEIPLFWQKLMRENYCEDFARDLPVLPEYRDVDLGVCTALKGETGEFSYVVGRPVSRFEGIPEGYFREELPPSTYGVFTTPPTDRDHFSLVIQLLTTYIYRTWLPASEFRYNENARDLEWYDQRSAGETNLRMEIWVPFLPR